MRLDEGMDDELAPVRRGAPHYDHWSLVQNHTQRPVSGAIREPSELLHLHLEGELMWRMMVYEWKQTQ